MFKGTEKTSKLFVACLALVLLFGLPAYSKSDSKASFETMDCLGDDAPEGTDCLGAAPVKEGEVISLSAEEDGGSGKKSELDEIREELKRNEKEALEFIIPDTKLGIEDIEVNEEYFTKTEQEQLLELWRSTIARNRTIQFVIKSLAPNPEAFEKNNSIMQTLTKAIYLPFYAATAITDNALINSGTSVGARVVGDLVNSVNEGRSKTQQIQRTDLMVMFMLVDEVAERLRTAYHNYKLVKIEKDLVTEELELAKVDSLHALELSAEASEQAAKRKSSKSKDSNLEGARASEFITRMIVRNLDRRLRELDVRHRSSRNILVELAGKDAVESVDLLINMEVKASLK